jgi:hypothetical protein
MKQLIKLVVVIILLPAMFIACKKDSNDDIPDIPSGPATVKDIDGNTYNTVKIGNQTWMAENLKTMRLNSGISITPFDEFS